MQGISSQGMFFTGSNRQIVPMTVAFNAYHAKFLSSVFPHGYVTTQNEEIKMLKANRFKKQELQVTSQLGEEKL